MNLVQKLRPLRWCQKVNVAHDDENALSKIFSSETSEKGRGEITMLGFSWVLLFPEGNLLGVLRLDWKDG